ncbi:MAG TPA: glycosyltransferase family 39 protein [Chthoniobacterales bacterium]|nr:glycosyltransferase family 39 protein [Chthoniobacterales bacterium]
MKLNRSVWLFLLVGIALRCVAINQPLVDAHLIRQCQTAAATKNLIETPGFHLSAQAPWMGDLDAPYILELPIYNYLVMGVNHVTGRLDLSGKVTSILLWALSFVCLQFIWRRALDSQQTFWANLLFVLAPLSLFYGQTFMPEMLVQALAFAFVLLVLRYKEDRSLLRWGLCVGVGLTGLLVKLPEIGHLYLILVFLIIRGERWKALARPRYLVSALITILALKGWSRYVDSVNATYFPEFTSSEVARYLVGPLASRLQFKPWAFACLYVGAFIVPGPPLLATVYGLYLSVRKYRNQFLGAWLISVAVAYILWFGTGPTAQSYYDLIALAPLCALFGIGMQEILAMKWIRAWPRAATVSAVLLVALPAIPVWKYLFKQDRQILAAARWATENTLKTDIILFRINHRPDMASYSYNTVPPYYSERLAFIWTKGIPEVVAQSALNHASYAIVTTPPPPVTDALAIVNRFRGKHPPMPESMEWLEKSGFRMLVMEKGFVVYRRN